MLTSIAVILIGIWLVIESQQHVSQTLTLIIGIVAAGLAILDLVRPYWGRVRVPPSAP